MPSLMLHLKIGEEYLKNNNIKNAEEFLKGCLAPDFEKDKRKSHFGKNVEAQHLSQILSNKTDLFEICKNIKLDTDFNKGVFLHLVTDDFFYKTYMLREMKTYKALEKMPLEDAHKALYQEYNRLAYYFYRTTPPDNLYLLPEVFKQYEQEKMKYFTEKDIDIIIEAMSNIDLQEIQNVTLKKGKNNATKSPTI